MGLLILLAQQAAGLPNKPPVTLLLTAGLSSHALSSAGVPCQHNAPDSLHPFCSPGAAIP